MAWLTKWGGFWGMLPVTTGRLFFVAPSATYTVEGRSYPASDNNDGLSPERALLTCDAAVGLCTADAGDTIVLLPGSHSWSTTVAVDVAGVTICGLPRAAGTGAYEHGTGATRYAASVTTTASAAVFTVTAARAEIAFVHIVPAAGQAGIDVAADDLNAHDITWNMTTAANTATFGVSVSGASLRPRISNHYVYVADNQGPWVRCAAAAGAMTGGIIQNSTVVLSGSTAWDDVIEITTGVDDLIIRDCDFRQGSGALMTDVIDVTGNTNDDAVTVLRCYFGVGADATQETATSDINLAGNVLAQIQGASGGTAVT